MGEREGEGREFRASGEHRGKVLIPCRTQRGGREAARETGDDMLARETFLREGGPLLDSVLCVPTTVFYANEYGIRVRSHCLSMPAR